MQEIVQAADSSAGSFYGRFALIEAGSEPIEFMAGVMVPEIVDLADQYRGLSRALVASAYYDEVNRNG